MSDRLTETFAYIVMCTAIVLFVWEWNTYRNRSEDDSWLVTRRRLMRRSLVSMVFLAIGVLLVVESRGVVDISRIPVLITYVSALGGMAIFLLVLAVLDLSDTARNAERHAAAQVQAAIEREKRRAAEERNSGAS